MAESTVIGRAPKDVTAALALEWHGNGYIVQNLDSSAECYWLIQEAAPVVGVDHGFVLDAYQTLRYRPKPATLSGAAVAPESRLWMWSGNGTLRVQADRPPIGA